ncbi:UNKNOWN [Stylonychia lemnae]|uniref:Uncharacterized protein n=1 Tax=Stylonychia lemnae TaxID=5949 RepID=A0A078BCL6_STYLE|nr:UNKNOWN [Stylonychia lemnae]|eukprot:CDW91348.1 UNKNOWN [Stylonychia lemnae]
MIVRTNYQQEEGKIIIYDEIQNTETPNKTYGSEDDEPQSFQDSESGSSSHRGLADQRFYGRQPNVLPQQYSVSDIRDYKLDTIQEGGSSISSGRSLNNSKGINFTNANLEDVNTSNMSSQKCKILNSTHGSHCIKKILKTDTDYQAYQHQFNNQKFYFPLQAQIYYQTQTSNCSPKNVQSPNNASFQRYGHNSFIYEVNQMRLQDTNLTDLYNLGIAGNMNMKRSFGNPKTPINLLNTQQIKDLSSNNSNYMFNSDERQIKNKGCSSSRYRYDSKEDDEEDEEYQFQFQIRPDDSNSNNATTDQILPGMPIQYLEYPMSTSNKSSNQTETERDNSILSFPANTAQKHQYIYHNNSEVDSSRVAEVSISKNILNQNFNLNGLKHQKSQKNLIVNQQQQDSGMSNDPNIVLQRHSNKNSNKQINPNVNTNKNNRVSSALTVTTIPDDESALMDEKPIVNLINYFSKQVSVNKENNSNNYQQFSNQKQKLQLHQQSFQRSPKIMKAQQMRGDIDEDQVYSSFSLSEDQSFEIRDKDTNKVIMRASIQQTQRHLRKISQMLEHQKSQHELFEKNIQIQYSSSSDQELGRAGNISKNMNSLEQGNTDESEVPPDTEREMIAGQRISVIKSILQKMLYMQSNNQRNEQQIIQTQWDRDEMLALTDIFKNIVKSEIENKQTTTNATFNSQDNTYLKVSQLEQQNLRLAKENEELKNKLRNKTKKSNKNNMININDENYYQSDEDENSHMSRNESIKSNTHQISSDYLMKERLFENSQSCNKCVTNRNSKVQCTQCSEKYQTQKQPLQLKPLNQTQLNSAKLTRATNTNANSSRGSFINQQNSVSVNSTAIELNKKLNSLNISENLGLKKKDLKPKVYSTKHSSRKPIGHQTNFGTNLNTTQKVSSFLKQ